MGRLEIAARHLQLGSGPGKRTDGWQVDGRERTLHQKHQRDRATDAMLPIQSPKAGVRGFIRDAEPRGDGFFGEASVSEQRDFCQTVGEATGHPHMSDQLHPRRRLAGSEKMISAERRHDASSAGEE